MTTTNTTNERETMRITIDGVEYDDMEEARMVAAVCGAATLAELEAAIAETN